MDKACINVLEDLKNRYSLSLDELKGMAYRRNEDHLVEEALNFLVKEGFVETSIDYPPQKEYKATQKGRNFLHNSKRDAFYRFAPIIISMVALAVSIIALFRT